jgi:hypothetical protein
MYTDPTGHSCEDLPAASRASCIEARNNQQKQKNNTCGNLPSQQRESCLEVFADPIPSFFSETDLWLLTATAMAETSNGEYPVDAIEMIVWVYLNRLSKTHKRIIDAVKGNQSAFCRYYSACFGYDKPLFREKEANETWSAYIEDLKKWINPNSAWSDVHKLVERVVQTWQKHGTGSNMDPTNGATDHRSKFEKELAIDKFGDKWAGNEVNSSASVYNFWSKKYGPKFKWFSYGPLNVNGEKFWIFFSNQLEALP